MIPQMKIDTVLASPTYEKIPSKKTVNEKVTILAIVGNSQEIDTEADRALLQQLPDADVSFLVEPQRKELTDSLWGKSWDILFFAGHSSSQGKDGTGRIYLLCQQWYMARGTNNTGATTSK
jgi:hypothetical protein